MYGSYLSLLIYTIHLDTTCNSPKEGAISYNKGHVCYRICEYVSLQLRVSKHVISRQSKDAFLKVLS